MIVTHEVSNTPESPGARAIDAASEPQAAPPVSSRFLFVDIAAQRAKQLRRGALPKLTWLQPDPTKGGVSRKPERIAMEEIRQGAIPYALPNLKPRPGQEAR